MEQNDSIKYKLGTEDNLSATLKGVNAHGEKLNATMEHSNSIVRELGKAFLEVFAVEKMIEFGKSSFEAFRTAEAGSVRLSAAAKNNVDAINELKEQGEKLEQSGLFSHVQTEQAETMALQFGLTSEQVKKAIPIISDFAAATHKSLDEATGAVLHGVAGMGRGLKQIGVTIDHTGDKSKDLANITSQLSAKFSGMNEVIAKTTSEGQLANFNNQVEAMKEIVGHGLADAFRVILPYLKDFVHGVKDVFQWLQDHTGVLKTIAVSVGVLAAEYLLYNVYLERNTILMALNKTALFISTLATEGLTAATALFGVTAAATWTAVTMGLSVVVVALYEAYENSDKFRAMMAGVGAVAMGLVPIFKALGEIIVGVFNPSLMIDGIRDMASAVSNFSPGALFDKAYDDSLSASKKSEKTHKLVASSGGNGSLSSADATDGGGSGGGGSKVTTINITIGSLVKELQMHVSSTGAGISNMKAEVTKALLESINDSQIIANQ